MVRQRRLTSDEVEAELEKRERHAEHLEGRAVVGESALAQAQLECDWARDAAQRAQSEVASKRTQEVLLCCAIVWACSSTCVAAHISDRNQSCCPKVVFS